MRAAQVSSGFIEGMRGRALHDRPPLALVTRAEGALRITAVNAAARGQGMASGMALAQARAMLPTLAIADHDTVADTRLLEAVADWADRYTPLVGRTPPDGLLLDLTGASHLYGGEADLRQDLLDRLARQGFATRAVVAETPGAAWALARFGSRDPIIPDGELRCALAPLPVDGLRLPADMVATLRRVGLKTIGDVMDRPRAPLAARFGPHLLQRLDQALGRDEEAIDPRQPIPSAEVAVRLVEPIVREEDIATTAQHLCEQLCALLEDRGQGARSLMLNVYRVDGAVQRISIGIASACREPKLLLSLLVLKLRNLADPLDPGFGFDFLRLAATSVGPLGAQALVLPAVDDLASACTSATLTRTVTRLGDRLAARFGATHVLRSTHCDTHLPEAAAPLVSVSRAAAKRQDAQQMPIVADDASAPLRPLRLFDPPELVEIMAEVPDGPPLRLRWRRQSLRIIAAEGPERIGAEWWRAPPDGEAPPDRDYYRVADETGRRLWLFREGLYPRPYESNQQKCHPRWFVHGIFA
jgi:protein ImuB